MGQRKGKEEKQRNRYIFNEIYTPGDMWVHGMYISLNVYFSLSHYMK